jgi:acyl-coenzyme A synthetase/AMP-(fatty) acid ligase
VLLDAAGEADVVAFNTDLAAITAETIFDVMHFGLWTGASYIWPAMTWTAGGTVVFNQGRADWRPFTETPTPTHVAVTPQMLDELLSAPASAYPRPPTLVLITVGGVVSRAQWRGTCERLTDDVRSVYGATETCLMTFTPVRTEDDLVWHRAHDDILQVVDDQDRPMAPDETGFLRLRASRGEAGYLNDPQTSRAFFRGGWFYPGDLAVADAEGRVSLQGRVTDVINLLGSKYPTIPMERGLQERLGARAVCVFSMPGLDGEAVHVAIEPGAATITAEALREALAACLPRMTQVQVHKVESLPRNHMGKVDRAALRGLLAKSGSSG